MSGGRESHGDVQFRERDFTSVGKFTGTDFVNWVDKFIIQVSRVSKETSRGMEVVLTLRKSGDFKDQLEFEKVLRGKLGMGEREKILSTSEALFGLLCGILGGF